MMHISEVVKQYRPTTHISYLWFRELLWIYETANIN